MKFLRINDCTGYLKSIFISLFQNPNVKEFPREEIAAQERVDQKICHKLLRYKHELIAVIVGVLVLLSLAIGLGVGLGH